MRDLPQLDGQQPLQAERASRGWSQEELVEHFGGHCSSQNANASRHGRSTIEPPSAHSSINWDANTAGHPARR